MRTILISLFVFVTMSAVAQDLKLNSFKKVEFGDLKSLEKTDYFYISPGFKIDTKLQSPFSLSSKDQKKSIEKYLNSKQPDFITAIDGMPIASPKGFNWNMPVAKPNSSVEYYIKERKIDSWIEPVTMAQLQDPAK